MIKRAILIVVLVLALLGIGHEVAQGQGTEESVCLTWNISGPDNEAIADELADGARYVPYVARISIEWQRMIQPATEWQIVLIVYCSADVPFETGYRDVMREVIRLYPQRWGSYAPLVG